MLQRQSSSFPSIASISITTSTSTTTEQQCNHHHNNNNNNKHKKNTDNKNNNKRAIVRFNPKAKMRLALHISDYETDEIKACFYHQNDYQRFRQDAKSTAQQVDKRMNINNDKNYTTIAGGGEEFLVSVHPTIFVVQEGNDNVFCARGVEGWTREGAARRSINRRMANVAVFLEQERVLQFPPPHQSDEQRIIMMGEEKEEYDDYEQQSFLSSTFYDHDISIAATYTTAACPSVALAQRIGLLDEQEVLKLWSSGGNNSSSSSKNKKDQGGKKSNDQDTLFCLNKNHIVDMDSSSWWSSARPGSKLPQQPGRGGGKSPQTLVFSTAARMMKTKECQQQKNNNKSGSGGTSSLYLRRLVAATTTSTTTG